MQRRDLLKLLLATGAGGIAAACAPRAVAVSPRSPFRLPRVRVAPDRIVATLVGLRPYRPAGFVLRSENLDGKQLIHSYGHGGGGITLSWGVAQLAFEEALASEQRDCAVLGCGVIGLATALVLQRRGWRVTIYARELPPDTTSNIAGGLWLPFSVYEEPLATPAFRTQFQRATRYAHAYFRSLLGARYGVRWAEHYALGDEPPPVPAFFGELRDVFPDTALLGPGEHPFPRRYARRDRVMQIDTPVFLQALETDFRAAGGRVVHREFRAPADVAQLAERVIVNCTGLGARALFGDTAMIPARGQLTMLAPQPEVQYGYGTDRGSIYMMSRSDGILLGGTFERDVWDLTPNAAESERIIRSHAAISAAMR